MRKKNAGYEHFLLFPQYFQYLSLSRSSKIGNWYCLEKDSMKTKQEYHKKIQDKKKPRMTEGKYQPYNSKFMHIPINPLPDDKILD